MRKILFILCFLGCNSQLINAVVAQTQSSLEVSLVDHEQKVNKVAGLIMLGVVLFGGLYGGSYVADTIGEGVVDQMGQGLTQVTHAVTSTPFNVPIAQIPALPVVPPSIIAPPAAPAA